MTLCLYSEICVMMWKKLNNRYRGMCGIFATYNSVLIHLLLLQSDTSTRSVSENLWYLTSFPEIFLCIVSKDCWTLMFSIEKIFRNEEMILIFYNKYYDFMRSMILYIRSYKKCLLLFIHLRIKNGHDKKGFYLSCLLWYSNHFSVVDINFS